jgi:outer membrane murein-binding lipoprotein Lpp
MDNQQPNQYPQTNDPTSELQPGAQTPQSGEPFNDPNFMQPEPAPTVVTPPKRGHPKFKKFLLWLLVLLLIAGAAAGAYLYQQQKLDQQKTAVTDARSQVSNLQSQLKAKTSQTKTTTTPATTTVVDILNGATDQTSQPGKVAFTTYYLPGNISDMWLEYGSSPSSFTKSTAHTSDGLDEGTAGEYGTQQWLVNNDQFTPGSTYFYRSAAKKGSDTIYSGVSVFTMNK